MLDIALLETDTEYQGPRYLRLYRQIRELIQDGTIRDGARLPSIRALRQQLCCSKTTVETAYQMLLQEGYVTSRPRSGLYVANPSSAAVSADRDGAPAIENPASDPARIGDGTAGTEREEPEGCRQGNGAAVDFSLLAVDGTLFPLQVWRRTVNEAFLCCEQSLHQYGSPQGEYELRDSLTRYLKSSRGVACHPGQIVIGSGIASSVQLLARLLGSGTQVAFEADGIAQVGDIFAQSGFAITPFRLNDEELPAAGLAGKNVRAMYVTPSHRPGGNPLPYPIRQRMLQWACEKGAYVIEDDYDGEFRYTGKTIPALQGLDRCGSVIYIGTFSKAFTPALRINYMVLPVPLLAKLNAAERLLSPPSRLDQLALSLFIEQGHWFRHIRRMRKLYRMKSERLKELIRRQWNGRIEVRGGDAGLHLELVVRTDCAACELVSLAAAEGVHVYGPQQVSGAAAPEAPSEAAPEAASQAASGTPAASAAGAAPATALDASSQAAPGSSAASAPEAPSEAVPETASAAVLKASSPAPDAAAPHSQGEAGCSRIYLGFGGVSLQEMERGVKLLHRAWSGLNI